MLTGDIGGKQVLKRHMEDVITYDVARSEELNDMDYQPHHKTLVIVRGGGDIATGTIYELHKKGYRLLSLEVAKPSCIRRQVSFGEAVYDRVSVVDGVTSVFVSTEEEMQEAWSRQQVPVVIDPKGMWIERLKPEVVVDAILAKRNLGTQKEMAPLVIGLGPGFEAGNDVDAVVETMRGERLGKIYYEGTALPNTGVPGVIAGYAKERVIHAPEAGRFVPIKEVGALVEKGETIAKIGDSDVYATMPGFLRGMIRPGYEVDKGLKIMDIEPRLSERERCFHISDKAAKIGVSVAEVIEQYENHQGE